MKQKQRQKQKITGIAGITKTTKTTRTTRILSFFLLSVLLLAGIPLPEAHAASTKPYLIKVNRQMCTTTIYEKDDKGEYTVPVKAMICSPSDYTPLGTFQTPAKYRWRLLVGDVWGQYSTRITGSILFHSVWYYEKDPSTVSHKQYNRLGTRCSLGCIRLTTEDAKWIYDNCPLGTTVVVYDSPDPGPLGKPEAMKLDESKLMGYDPTDIWSEGNPYIKKPTIKGVKNQTVNYGKNVDLMKGIEAKNYDGKVITSDIQLKITYNKKTVKKVDTKKAGAYQITYRVTNSEGITAEEKAVCTVVDNVAPKISGVKKKYLKEKPNKENVLAGIKVTWHGKKVKAEDVSVKWKKTSSKNGVTTYKLTYSYQAANGKSVKAETKAYYDKKAPVFSGVAGAVVLSPKELTDEFLRADISVSDNLDSLTMDDVKITLKEIEAGHYEAVYQVSDRAGNLTKEKAYYIVESGVWFEGVKDRIISPEQIVDEAFVKEGVSVSEHGVDKTDQMKVEIAALEGRYEILYQLTDEYGDVQTAKAVFTVEASSESQEEAEKDSQEGAEK